MLGGTEVPLFEPDSVVDSGSDGSDESFAETRGVRPSDLDLRLAAAIWEDNHLPPPEVTVHVAAVALLLEDAEVQARRNTPGRLLPELRRTSGWVAKAVSTHVKTHVAHPWQREKGPEKR